MKITASELDGQEISKFYLFKRIVCDLEQG